MIAGRFEPFDFVTQKEKIQTDRLGEVSLTKLLHELPVRSVDPPSARLYTEI